MRLKIFAFALSISFLLINSAFASVIFQQPFTGSTSGKQSDATFHAFDDFSITNSSTVNSVQWYGSGPSTMFSLRFFGDDPNSQFGPDLNALLFSQTITPNVVTGVNGTAVNQYSAGFSTPLSFSANARYWISVVGLDGFFGWSVADVAGVSTSLRISNNTFSLQQGNAAFALINSQVPLPAAFPLFLVGIAGIGAIAKGRRRAA